MDKIVDLRWKRNFQLAKTYFEIYGNLEIPHNFKTKFGFQYDEDGVNLGNWIRAQREAYKNRGLPVEERTTKRTPLTDEQVKLLESIGMVWDVPAEIWDKMYNLSKEYYNYHGNLEVPIMFKTTNGYEYDDDGINLGIWISHQRTSYRKKNLSKGETEITSFSLTDKQIKLLESIGMIWSLRKNKVKVLELCSEIGIDILKNRDILEHISYPELSVKILYLKDNDMPIEIDGILHEIFSMSSMNMKLKYNVSLEDLVNIYMKGRNL